MSISLASTFTPKWAKLRETRASERTDGRIRFENAVVALTRTLPAVITITFSSRKFGFRLLFMSATERPHPSELLFHHPIFVFFCCCCCFFFCSSLVPLPPSYSFRFPFLSGTTEKTIGTLHYGSLYFSFASFAVCRTIFTHSHQTCSHINFLL